MCPANNIKWFIDESGVKVKPCAQCHKVYPYTQEFYYTRGKGKWSAYCKKCTNEQHQKYDKTDATRKTNKVFVVNGVEYKTCTKCGNTYLHTFEFFDHSTQGQGGFRSDCRKCRVKYDRKLRQRNWAHGLYLNAKHRGFEMNIDTAYILELFEKQHGKCYWFGVDMVPSDEPRFPTQPSLDRLDRTKGYIKGNVVLCCFSANFGRNQCDDDTWKLFLTNLQQNLDYSQWMKIKENSKS